MNEIVRKDDTLEIIYHELDRDPAIKSKHTRRGYRADLRDFEAWRAGRPFNRTLVGEFAAALQDKGLAPATINRKLAAVRWWARRLADLAHEDPRMTPELRQQVITQADRAAAIKDVTGDRHERTGRHIPMGEIERIILTCQADDTPAGVRDAAIFALFRAGGLRRSELAALALADLTPAEEGEFDLFVRQGKGDKSRIIPINNGAALALADWLAVRGKEPGALFCRIRKGGRILAGDYITGDALRQILNKRCDQANVPHITTHDWRRTFAGDLLDRGVDIATVADLMGHSSVTTTKNYDRRGEARKRRAVQSLFVPYHRRD